MNTRFPPQLVLLRNPTAPSCLLCARRQERRLERARGRTVIFRFFCARGLARAGKAEDWHAGRPPLSSPLSLSSQTGERREDRRGDGACMVIFCFSCARGPPHARKAEDYHACPAPPEEERREGKEEWMGGERARERERGRRRERKGAESRGPKLRTLNPSP